MAHARDDQLYEGARLRPHEPGAGNDRRAHGPAPADGRVVLQAPRATGLTLCPVVTVTTVAAPVAGRSADVAAAFMSARADEVSARMNPQHTKNSACQT